MSRFDQIERERQPHVVNNYGGGASGLTLLGIAFVVLKLTGYIDWSWWLVLLPFWGGLATLIIIGVVWWLAIVSLQAWLNSRARKARLKAREAPDRWSR